MTPPTRLENIRVTNNAYGHIVEKTIPAIGYWCVGGVMTPPYESSSLMVRGLLFCRK